MTSMRDTNEHDSARKETTSELYREQATAVMSQMAKTEGWTVRAARIERYSGQAIHRIITLDAGKYRIETAIGSIELTVGYVQTKLPLIAGMQAAFELSPSDDEPSDMWIEGPDPDALIRRAYDAVEPRLESAYQQRRADKHHAAMAAFVCDVLGDVANLDPTIDPTGNKLTLTIDNRPLVIEWRYPKSADWLEDPVPALFINDRQVPQPPA